MNAGTIRGRALVLSSLLMACAGSKENVAVPAAGSASAAQEAAPPAAGATPSAQGAAPPSQSAAPSAQPTASQAAAPATASRPFAKNALEAQTLIQAQIDEHIKTLWKCVTDYRSMKGDPHKAVTIDIGIDQEGSLLGVVSPNLKHGDLDPDLKACLTATLHGLPFPRSHAGVITVRQHFSDVYMNP
jgi:hypothetical protein